MSRAGFTTLSFYLPADIAQMAMRLSYTNVRLNPTLEPKLFAFQAPPDAKVQDETEVILDGLEKAMQVEAAKKKNAAAEGKGEDAVLKQSIDVPKPPGAPQ